MASRSFETRKAELELACEDLRAFTLGLRGAGPIVGRRAIDRVNALCEAMKKRFATGPQAARVAAIVASVRGRVLAAEARLTILTRKAAASM